MLSKPFAGWTEFELGDFKSRASYLTYIPEECIFAFLYSLENCMPTTIHFDAEGWDFYLTVSADDCYIVDDMTGEMKVTRLDMTRQEIINEFIEDIELYKSSWQQWGKGFQGKDLQTLNELNNAKYVSSCVSCFEITERKMKHKDTGKVYYICSDCINTGLYNPKVFEIIKGKR